MPASSPESFIMPHIPVRHISALYGPVSQARSMSLSNLRLFPWSSGYNLDQQVSAGICSMMSLPTSSLVSKSNILIQWFISRKKFFSTRTSACWGSCWSRSMGHSKLHRFTFDALALTGPLRYIRNARLRCKVCISEMRQL